MSVTNPPDSVLGPTTEPALAVALFCGVTALYEGKAAFALALGLAYHQEEADGE